MAEITSVFFNTREINARPRSSWNTKSRDPLLAL